MASKNYEYLENRISKLEDKVYELRDRIEDYEVTKMKYETRIKDLEYICDRLMNLANRR